MSGWGINPPKLIEIWFNEHYGENISKLQNSSEHLTKFCNILI
jgi:hypothetical protein